MIIWTPNAGYVVSFKNYDPTIPAEFEWPKPRERKKLLADILHKWQDYYHVGEVPKRALVGQALMSLDLTEGPKHIGVTFKPTYSCAN